MIKLSLVLGLLLACMPLAHADDTSGAPAAAASSAAPEAAPTAASTPPAAPTAPFMLAADKLSSGDTAWMLTSTALVLMMTVPGLALFYGGMVRKKNVLATLMQSFACTCVVSLLWWVVGYSWAFTPGNGFLGGASRMLFEGVRYVHGDSAASLSVSHLAPTIPESVYAMFQMTFAIITPALIAGAFADRMKFSAMLLFLAAWSLLVYAPIAHMVWEPHRLAERRRGARLCGRNGGAHQRGHRGPRELPGARQTPGLRTRGDAASQSDVHAHRRIAPVGGLVRVQRRIGGRGRWARGYGHAGDATCDRRGGARLDVHRMGCQG